MKNSQCETCKFCQKRYNKDRFGNFMDWYYGRFHDLRHTFAVLQLECGTDLDTLRRLMGHSKISITSNNYLHQNMTLIKKASVAMDNIIDINCDNNVTNLKNSSPESTGS